MESPNFYGGKLLSNMCVMILFNKKMAMVSEDVIVVGVNEVILVSQFSMMSADR